jgi:NAD(P)-dependent dehydrogenase (short-subunit alcohol dehydrogenase family)
MSGGGALANRSIVVTGAGRGLGRAYALDAAAAGAAVLVNDVDGDVAAETAAAIEAAGGTALASADDVSTPAGAQAVVARCEQRLGPLRGLVNNAGLYHEAPPWEDDPERVVRLVNVNVNGALLCTGAAARAMRAHGQGGAIVNASSGGMFGFPTVSAYAASKGALASLTWASALDLEAIDVRVNAISPMAVTRMTQGALGRTLVPSGADRAPLDGIEERTPERIAPLVTFLLSDRAADVTGQFLRFNGDRLSVVRTYAFDEHPFAERPSWDLDAFAAALERDLAGRLEPYGVERRLPPRMR